MYPYLAAGLCAILISITWRIIFNVFFSPLACIPGPLIAKITSKWLILVDISGNRTTTIHRLHKQYGHTVRVGPNEVSFAEGGLIKELYGQSSSFMKAPVYDDFSQHPVGIFSTRDRVEHRQRRKLLSHAFAQSNLLEIEPVIGDVVKQVLRKIDEAMGRSTDTLALLRMFALDVVGELFLGKSFDALKTTKPPAFIRDLDVYFMVVGMESGFPWIFKVASYFPSKEWQEFKQAPGRLRVLSFNRHGENALRDYRLRRNADPKGTKHKDLLNKMFTPPENLSTTPGVSTEMPMTDQQISMEIGNLVFAGTDTTSTTLTYLFWQLAQSKWQELLREELATIHSVNTVAAFADVDQCPILNAVITESLRLFPAAPASLQHETPAGGKELSGYFIPGGTVVSMQCYTTQRDGAIFHDPETFDPARWMQVPEKLIEMNLYQMPFSKGVRACLGKNLAMMELKLMVTAVIKHYHIKVADSMKPGDMNMKDHFLTMPACGRCDLIFTAV